MVHEGSCVIMGKSNFTKQNCFTNSPSTSIGGEEWRPQKLTFTEAHLGSHQDKLLYEHNT